MSRGVNRKPWCEPEGGVLYTAYSSPSSHGDPISRWRSDLPMEERLARRPPSLGHLAFVCVAHLRVALILFDSEA